MMKHEIYEYKYLEVILLMGSFTYRNLQIILRFNNKKNYKNKSKKIYKIDHSQFIAMSA